jgi:hypothetical protein
MPISHYSPHEYVHWNMSIQFNPFIGVVVEAIRVSIQWKAISDFHSNEVVMFAMQAAESF